MRVAVIGAGPSGIAAAKNLHGRLLLVHGMMDDNVHVQNSTRLARALQNAGKPFEMMFYPENRHGVGGKHYQRLQNEFITRTLGVTATAAPPAEKKDDGSPEPEPPRRRRPPRPGGAPPRADAVTDTNGVVTPQ